MDKILDDGLGGLEQQLLRLLLAGHTISSAARSMHVSQRSAEGWLAELRERTGAVNLYSLGAAAERFGWHDCHGEVDQ